MKNETVNLIGHYHNFGGQSFQELHDSNLSAKESGKKVLLTCNNQI